MSYIDRTHTVLTTFEPINLEAMDDVKLLNRDDYKFLFTIDNLPDLLLALQPYYRVLSIEGKNMFSYESLYFDTPEFLFYLMHHNGKQSRYKVRYRKYLDSDLCYLEVKIKNNKGKTFKLRKKKRQVKTELSEKSMRFVNEIVPLSLTQLEPKAWSFYNRLTLVNKHLKERVTIDTSLGFSYDGKQEVKLPFLVCAEAKQEKLTMESFFMKKMREKKLLPVSFSKYCIGSLLLYPELKQNRFKEKLLMLKKLSYARA